MMINPVSHYWTALEMKNYYHRTCQTLVTQPYSVPVYSLTIVKAIPVAYTFCSSVNYSVECLLLYMPNVHQTMMKTLGCN